MAKDVAVKFLASGKSHCIIVVSTWRFRVPLWPDSEQETKRLRDAFWIFYAPEDEIKHCSARNLAFFDAILTYPAHDHQDQSEELDLRHIDIPGLEDSLTDILCTIPPQRVRLVGMTEQCLRRQAHLRKTYGIPGVLPDDSERFTCKISMQRCFMAAGVRSAPFIPLGQVQDRCVECCKMFLQDVQSKVGYPVLLKPANSASCYGIITAANQHELWAALQSMDPNAEYLIEKRINHDVEYTPTVLVYGGAIVGKLGVTETIGNVLESHRHMNQPSGSVTVDPASNEYAEVMEVTKRAFEAMQPVPDGLFNVQVMREAGTGCLFAGEVCVRVTGFDTELIFASTGICTELLLIHTQSPGFVAPEIVSKYHSACVRFYQRNGLLREKRERSARESISSDMVVIWGVEEGEEMKVPDGVHHEELATVVLLNKDAISLTKDFQSMMYNKLSLFEITEA